MPESLMRVRDGGHDAGRVTYVELFFDLVFVFAVTQLSHTLLEDLSPLGWLKTTVLMVGLWWMWIDTSWVTNWLNPERWPVRILLLVLMLGGLVLSTSVPHAFDSRALVFGFAYGATHVLRTGVMLVTLRREGRREAGTFGRMLVWHGLLAAAWATGALAAPELRLPIWGAAILVETALPAFGYWVPGLGRAHASDWASVEGGHMAERCALFIIIALGESILVTGATVADLPWTPSTVGAFIAAFVGSVAMWWIYFSRHAEIGLQRIAHSHDPGAVARSAYTYLHIPIVAGIIVTAVGDERVLHHPDGHTDVATAAAVLIGPGLYLVGAALFKYAISRRISPPRICGMIAMAALWPAAGHLSPLQLSAAATAVLIAVAAWEGWALSHAMLAVKPEVDAPSPPARKA